MCVALKYVVDGKTRTAAAGVQGTTIPVLMRSGQVKWVEWGAPVGCHISNPEAPGYLMKFPPDNWVDFAAHLVKPVDPDKLRDSLQAVALPAGPQR
jgi:hypothetical protein